MLAGVSLSACSSEPPLLPAPKGYTEQTFFFEALGEPVRIIKSAHVSYAILGDGTQVSLPMLRKLHRAAHRRSYGPRLRGFDLHLKGLPPDTPVRAALHYHPSVDWDDLAPRLFKRGSPEAKAAQAELVAAIAEDSAALAAELEAQGFELERAGRDMPVLFVRAPAGQLLALNDARWSMVMGEMRPAEPSGIWL